MRLELGQSLLFFTDDFLGPLLERCPNLQELRYFVHFAHAVRLPANWPGHANLQRICLHGQWNHCFGEVKEVVEHVKRHFELFAGERAFPVLNCIVLFGGKEDWSGLLATESLGRVLESIRARRCLIERTDGSPAWR